jgi:mannosylglucosylglycerate synthase
MPIAAVISFRLGGSDGVSIEASKWTGALRQLGFGVRRIAGTFGAVEPFTPDDVLIAGLAIDASETVDAAEVTSALVGVDLVIVENLLSLPMNLDAARAVTAALRGHHGRVVLHHHDLAWQREHHRHVTELPPVITGALHVTVNDHSRLELERRGFDAVTVRNHFTLDGPAGNRARARAELAVTAETIVVLQPTRAIPRKNVPAGLGLAEALAELTGRPVLYWLTGPAEDGYGPTLDAVLADARVPVRRGLWGGHRKVDNTATDIPPGTAGGPALDIADAYAACDVVAFPSTWEGFGNPAIESIVARRPLAAGHYPALDELAGLGLTWLDVDDPAAIARFIELPDADRIGALEVSRQRVAAHLDLAELPRHLAELFHRAGWAPW